jgi:hypothetical protein
MLFRALPEPTKETTMPEPIYVSVRIPKEIYDAVSEVAEEEERSISSQVRRILKRYLSEREETPLAA